MTVIAVGRPPNPYRVLAHAIDERDTRLAELLSARLLRRDRRCAVGPGRVVERLVEALGQERLGVQRAEEHAERVLAAVPGWIWDGETLPVPVEDIADSVFGLLVRDVEDMSAAPRAPTLAPGQSLSGLLLAGRGEIWVNAEEARTWPSRRRFTISHELGHWELHRDGQGSLFCRRTSVDEQPPREPDVVDIEEEASRFAAALLMPAWLMVREHARVGGDLGRLITTFRTSGVAMTRRVEDLFAS